MNDPGSTPVQRAIATVLGEILDGAAADSGWLLNRTDIGLLRSLDALSAEQASSVPTGGASSVAAHVDHLRYGIELLNRWSRGERAFEDADWSASWRRVAVSEPEWAALRGALRDAAGAWKDAAPRAAGAGEEELTTVLAAVAHLAYHLGAIRQIARSARGPEAND